MHMFDIMSVKMNFELVKVLSTDGLDKKGIKILRDSGLEVVEEKLSKVDLIKRLPEFDVIIIRSATVIDAEIIKAVSKCEGSRLKIIARAGTGVDNIDMDAATDSGILVLNTPAANTVSAAEHTFALMCCLSRQIPQAYMTMQQQRWDRKSFMGTELDGKTLAIIGLGRIGREVAVRAQAFRMKTIGYDPIVTKEDAASLGIESMDLKQIWPLADYITVHVPLIPQTENLFNTEVFSLCKPGFKIINCSRGGIINEDDLLKALDSGICSGAALDVFTQEPPVFGDLIKHPNLISTPHLGASTKEAQYRVSIEIAENLVSIAKYDKFNGLVNGNVVGLLQHKEHEAWQLLLSVLSKGIDRSKKIELFYDDITSFSKQRGFEDFLKGSLVMFLLTDSENINLINAGAAATSHNLRISVVKRQKSISLNTPSLGLVVDKDILEMSVWKNNVYLTGYNGVNLSQPVLMKKGCFLLITTDPKKSSKYIDSHAASISSFIVNDGLHVFVTDGSKDPKISGEFDFFTKL